VPYEVRRSAIFCLGNLVNNHSTNAALLAEARGVQYLSLLIEKEEDEELSKKVCFTFPFSLLFFFLPISS
jgi:hypothetical protein